MAGSSLTGFEVAAGPSYFNSYGGRITHSLRAPPRYVARGKGIAPAWSLYMIEYSDLSDPRRTSTFCCPAHARSRVASGETSLQPEVVKGKCWHFAGILVRIGVLHAVGKYYSDRR